MEFNLSENVVDLVEKSLNLAFQSTKLLEKCIDKQEFFEKRDEIEEGIVEDINKKEIIETVKNNILLIEKGNKDLQLEKNIKLNEEISDIVDMLKRANICIENMLNGKSPIVNYEIVTFSGDDEEEIETLTPAEMYIRHIKKDIFRLVKELKLARILY